MSSHHCPRRTMLEGQGDVSFPSLGCWCPARGMLVLPRPSAALGEFCTMNCDSAFVLCRLHAARGSPLLTVPVLKSGACALLRTEKITSERPQTAELDGGKVSGGRSQTGSPFSSAMGYGPDVLSPAVVEEMYLLRSFFPPTLYACVGLD